MKTRWKILIGLAPVLGIAVLAAVAHHFQLKAAVNRYRAELKAKGEPMELAEVLPPSVPPEQDWAHLFTNAIAQLNTNNSVLSSNQPPMMRMVAPGKAMVGWRQIEVRESGKQGATNSWAEIDAALKEEQAALDLLYTLPLQPVFNFKLNYAAGFGKMKFSPLASGKKAVQRLASATVNHLRRGEVNFADQNILAMLAVDNGFSHDRTLISELVRIAIAQITLTANWEWLQSSGIKDTQLAAVQQSWENLEFIRPFENSMAIERVVGAIELTTLRNSGLEAYFDRMNILGLFDFEEGLVSNLKIKCKSAMWHYWWSYPDELRELKGIQFVVEATRQAQTYNSFFVADKDLKTKIESLGIKPDEGDAFWFTDPAKADFHFIISSSLNAFETAFKKVMKVETAKQMTITAIALKRFQLKHGSFPQQLAELTPEFLASVPLDPVDGQPLRYRLNADGSFTLYSVAENGKDDGGDPAMEPGAQSASFQWQNAHALDWVWPQPATAAEVQKYYAEQANKP